MENSHDPNGIQTHRSHVVTRSDCSKGLLCCRHLKAVGCSLNVIASSTITFCDIPKELLGSSHTVGGKGYRL